MTIARTAGTSVSTSSQTTSDGDHERDADESDDATTDELSNDELFHTLQNERRRQVLKYVIANDGPFEMRSVAEQVAAWEHDTTVRKLTSKQRQRVYIALYQSHLPKLDEVGLIRYQQDRGVVEATDRIDAVVPHIGSVEADGDTPDDAAPPDGPADAAQTNEGDTPSLVKYYIGATACSTLLVAAVWTTLVPNALLSSQQLAALVTGLFALPTIVLAATTTREDSSAE